MDALQIIDMHNKKLVGSIHDFLGDLPNLMKLNLTYNSMTGSMPASLATKRHLDKSLKGNRVIGKSASIKKSGKLLMILKSLIQLSLLSFLLGNI
ncbi:Leucine-rich repeat protein kinase family protein [Quillaja saponaria]|uniref:Leucine-rich repeat protein kinase family protein n=1 Tax=Quillaja saponaria TaxID=32244 RepID=A0AAD7PBC9_QUISA|nr:Leucine-rich repeat protein kinase family protein [Quillaja saponaria]